MPAPEQLLSFIGEIVAYGGSGAAIAYLTFQHLGKSWIENKFAQRLEQHKHMQALELQRLRVEIDSMLNGALKIQEREFTLLPEAWAKLDEAHKLVSSLVCPIQSEADVNGKTERELEEFLTRLPFTETEKDKIRNSRVHQRHVAYGEIRFLYQAHDVKRSITELHTFVARNGIFFPSEINELIASMTNLLWSAIVTKEEGIEDNDHKMQGESWKKVKEEIEPLYESIKSAIQIRLQSHAKNRS